jgi:protein-L-isoaspartate(D-aspartate) O-methyltransferase
VPQAILDQLAEGGRLVVALATDSDLVRLTRVRLYRRIGDSFSSVSLFEAAAPILPGFEFKPHFTF